MRTDNRTLNGIRSEEERYFLITWNIIVITASLIGDSIILISTSKYKAIRQHKIIVAVIQHMATCDILQAIFKVIPTTLALFSDGWALGEMLCHVQDIMSMSVCTYVTMILTCCMTTSKFIIAKRPLRSRTWTTKLGHKICFAVWFLTIVSLITPALIVLPHLNNALYFSYREYGCDYTPSLLPVWFVWYYISVFSLIGICYPTLILTSALLLITARRAASRHDRLVKWEGVRNEIYHLCY